jgi:signal transduction histidine kinase
MAGAMLLALVVEESALGLGKQTISPTRLWISLGVGIVANLLLGVLVLIPFLSEQLLGVIGILLDSLLAALFLWAYRGAVPPLMALGMLAILAASIRFGWRGVIPTMILLALSSLLALGSVGDLAESQWVNWGLSLALLITFGAVGVVLRSGGRVSQHGVDPREIEAERLRSARERARAITDMTSTLSATLNHRKVLAEAQQIGELALREQMEPGARLISTVMLFQGEDNQLRVITSRGLTRADEAVALPGRKGILGLALKGSDPVFAGDCTDDPELRYVVAFQNTKSVLVIPLRAGIDMYGVMIFGSTQADAFSDEHVEMLTAIGTQATLSLQNAVLYQNLLTEKEKIVEVEEDARKKLARDLHDGPTQSVAAIAMRVNYIRRLIERQPQQAVEELWKVEELARRTTKEIRHMLFTLRPLVLETQGLMAALQQLAEKMKETHDTNVLVEGSSELEMFMDVNTQGVLFYIVEEAVNNARKHAQSEHIWVRLARRENMIITEIEDDGVGFDVDAVDSNYDQRGSLGMVNMRERAELIEGTLRIQSARGSGTKITVIVPMQLDGEMDGAASPDDSSQPLQLQSYRAGAQKSASEAALPPEPPASTTRPKPLPRPQAGGANPALQTGRPGTGPLRPPQPPPAASSPRPAPSDSQIRRPPGLTPTPPPNRRTPKPE